MGMRATGRLGKSESFERQANTSFADNNKNIAYGKPYPSQNNNQTRTCMLRKMNLEHFVQFSHLLIIATSKQMSDIAPVCLFLISFLFVLLYWIIKITQDIYCQYLQISGQLQGVVFFFSSLWNYLNLIQILNLYCMKDFDSL